MAGKAVIPPMLPCLLCSFDDDVVITHHPDGEHWIYTCTSPEHPEPYIYEKAIPKQARPSKSTSGSSGEGIMADLGLYEDLLACVVPGESWLEYGIVEHRYKLLRPDVYFDELLPRYGHTALGKKAYTTASLLGQALSRLNTQGSLTYQWGKATGFWSYNGQISYWAVPPGLPGDQTRAWESFATGEGLDPNAWDLTRR